MHNVYLTELHERLLEEKKQRYNHNRWGLPEGMHYCNLCDSVKPEIEFGKSSKTRTGVRCTCKACDKRRHQENKPQAKAKMRIRNLRVNFGISEEEYKALFDAQGGVCAICGNRETKMIAGMLLQLSIDHDHETGKIRGLLCGACNLGLGSFRDSLANLSNAIDYLMDTHR